MTTANAILVVILAIALVAYALGRALKYCSRKDEQRDADILSRKARCKVPCVEGFDTRCIVCGHEVQP